MKNISKIVLFCVLLVISVSSAFSQAKKPTIMVVPSDIWCIRNGYTMDYEEMGQTKKIPDYKSAMQNSAEMRAMVSEIADFMQSNDFPIKDLEQELKRLEDEAAEAMAGFETYQRKYLPMLIMGKPEDFDKVWDEYVSLLKPLTKIYNEWMQTQVDHRVELFGGFAGK